MGYTMYDMLLQLPLFQGLSKGELSELVEKVKFHFQKAADGASVFRQGELCTQLAFVLSGELVASTEAPCGTFIFEEVLGQGAIIEPQSLFGRRPSYKATYRARGEVAVLTIDKQYLYGVLDAYEVFRMNFFNQLSSRADHFYERIWSIGEQRLEGRVAHFIRSLCTTMQGPKTMRIKMTDLALLMDDTRLNVSAVLNKWQTEGLVSMHRGLFVVHDIALLP